MRYALSLRKDATNLEAENMKERPFLKCFQILSILMCLFIIGCRDSNSGLSMEKHTTQNYPNYTLDNGEGLLGNNNYQAISYSGYRTSTRTAENCPSVEDIKENMKILSAMGIKLLRTYNTQGFPQTAVMLQAISQLKQADPNFEIYVMLGAWIQCAGAYSPSADHSRGDYQRNKREIDAAIEFANQYPDIVKIIAVGNEAMVDWQQHFVPASVILKWVKNLKDAQKNGKMPAKILITTSDNWVALGGTENYHNDDLLELLRQIDFVSLHTYAFHDTFYILQFKWAQSQQDSELSITEQSIHAIKRAVNHQIKQYESAKNYLNKNGIHKFIHIGETGWASLDNSHYGSSGTCAADEYKAKLFYDAVKKMDNSE